MNYVITFLIFCTCFLAMAVGVIFAKKVLKKGCCASPDDPDATCACHTKEP